METRICKQKISKNKMMPKQSNMRQRSTEMPLSLFCIDQLVGMGPTLKCD